MSRVLITVVAAALVWAATGGCKSAQKPVKPEMPLVSAGYTGGSPLHERQTTMPATAAAGVEVMDIEAFSLADSTRSVLEPFGGQSTLITGTGDSSIRAISEELAAARFGKGDDVAAFAQQLVAGNLGPYGGPASIRGAIAVGMTVRIEAADQTAVSLLIGHDRVDMLRIGLAIPGSQLLALSDLPHDPVKGQQMAVVLPAKPSGSIVYLVKIRPAKDSKEASQALALMKPAQQAARAIPTVEQLLVQQSLKTAAENRSARRSAVVYLASQARASICEDAALSADDDFLQLLVDLVAKRLAEPSSSADMPSISWTLDSAAFDLLARMQLQKKLSARLTAVLLVHAGEVGRSGSSLEQLIGKAASRKDLENRLIAENFLYLEDVSPAARIRAYDWLSRKGKAPSGFDPLAPAAERKKAIDAAVEAMAQQSAETSK